MAECGAVIRIKSKFYGSEVITHKQFPMTAPGLISALAEAEDMRGHVAQAGMAVLMGDSQINDKKAHRRGADRRFSGDILSRCTWVEIVKERLSEKEEKRLKSGPVDQQIANCRAFLSDFPSHG